MTIRGGSPKKFAKDIADGFLTLTVANLKKYKPHELKMILSNMLVVSREIRAERPDDDDFNAIKKKNWRLQNLSRTQTIINAFIKSRRIKL